MFLRAARTSFRRVTLRILGTTEISNDGPSEPASPRLRPKGDCDSQPVSSRTYEPRLGNCSRYEMSAERLPGHVQTTRRLLPSTTCASGGRASCTIAEPMPPVIVTCRRTAIVSPTQQEVRGRALSIEIPDGGDTAVVSSTESSANTAPVSKTALPRDNPRKSSTSERTIQLG